MVSPWARRQLATRRRRRHWAIGLGVLGALVVVLAAVTVGVNVRSTSTSGPVTSPSGGGTTTIPASPTTSSAAAPGAPTISALTPSAGPAGQTIIVSGTNLISADGHVEVRFGGQAAPTSCPAPTSCTATVPSSATGGRVLVTVATAAGTSNGLWFTYR